MKHETGICYNCGADEGLHHYETMQCPRHGIEEERIDEFTGKYYPQRWENTTFEDSGLKKLHDAAHELLEALMAMDDLDKLDHLSDEWWKQAEICDKLRNEVIKKATE